LGSIRYINKESCRTCTCIFRGEQFPVVLVKVAIVSGCRRLSMSNVVEFSPCTTRSFASEAEEEGISGNRKDQELTDSVMLEMEPRPSPTPQLTPTTSVALSEDEEMDETLEGGLRPNPLL